ncbi:hypothetical protein AAMO2058_001593800 [Amorphochlora amoebiformis]
MMARKWCPRVHDDWTIIYIIDGPVTVLLSLGIYMLYVVNEINGDLSPIPGVIFAFLNCIIIDTNWKLLDHHTYKRMGVVYWTFAGFMYMLAAGIHHVLENRTKLGSTVVLFVISLVLGLQFHAIPLIRMGKESGMPLITNKISKLVLILILTSYFILSLSSPMAAINSETAFVLFAVGVLEVIVTVILCQDLVDTLVAHIFGLLNSIGGGMYVSLITSRILIAFRESLTDEYNPVFGVILVYFMTTLGFFLLAELNQLALFPLIFYPQFAVSILFVDANPIDSPGFFFGMLTVVSLYDLLVESGWLYDIWFELVKTDKSPIRKAIYMGKKYEYLRQKVFAEQIATTSALFMTIVEYSIGPVLRVNMLADYSEETTNTKANTPGTIVGYIVVIFVEICLSQFVTQYLLQRRMKRVKNNLNKALRITEDSKENSEVLPEPNAKNEQKSSLPNTSSVEDIAQTRHSKGRSDTRRRARGSPWKSSLFQEFPIFAPTGRMRGNSIANTQLFRPHVFRLIFVCGALVGIRYGLVPVQSNRTL